MCQLHTVAIDVHNALFQSNNLVMESSLRGLNKFQGYGHLLGQVSVQSSQYHETQNSTAVESALPQGSPC